MAKSSKSPVKRSLIQRFFSSTTARSTGWRESIGVMGALILVGGVFALLPIASGMMTATLASYITAYEISLLAIVSLALFNYGFFAVLESLKLKALPVKPTDTHAGVNLLGITKTLKEVAQQHELAQAKKENRKARKFIKDISVSVFTSAHSKKIICAPRLFRSCALLVPSGLFDEHASLTEQEIAALMLVELMKARNAYARRGILNTIAKVGLYFMQLIEDAIESPYAIVRWFGYASGPLQFFLLYEKSCSRTYHFEAMKDAIEVGGEPFRKALKNAYIKIGRPSIDIPSLDALPAEHQEKPKKNVLSWTWGKWIRKQWKYFRKGGYEFCEMGITHVGKGINEAYSDTPSATNTMEFIDNHTPWDLVVHNLGDDEVPQERTIYASTNETNHLVLIILNPKPSAQANALQYTLNMTIEAGATLTNELLKDHYQDIIKELQTQIDEDALPVKLYEERALPEQFKVFSTQPLPYNLYGPQAHDHHHGHPHDNHGNNGIKPPTTVSTKDAANDGRRARKKKSDSSKCAHSVKSVPGLSNKSKKRRVGDVYP